MSPVHPDETLLVSLKPLRCQSQLILTISVLKTKAPKPFAAYLKACDEGTVGSREEFLAQFPEIADDLRSAMEAADALDRFTGVQSTQAQLPTTAPEDETVNGLLDQSELSGGDPAATLPEANRPKGDSRTDVAFRSW